MQQKVMDYVENLKNQHIKGVVKKKIWFKNEKSPSLKV
jgi:hypothetical protein